MVNSRSPGINVSSANRTVATSRVAASDSDVARDGDAILPSGRQSYRATDEGGSRVNGAPAAIEWSESGPPSLSMSVDLHNLVNPNLQDSGHYSASPERVDAAAASSCNVAAVRGHDEEESYEAFGSVEGDADDGVDSPGGSSSAPSPTGTNSLRNPRSPNSTIVRHSRLRTSLRRTPPCSGRKRLSSNALASQLYRSGSFNSSGRGSICDPADDMYSDVSLEDDVIDLNHRMCASNSPCRSPPHSGSAGESHSDSARFHQPHPPHPPHPYAYYPPPYPPINPYGHYGPPPPYHPGAFYPPPYCNDVAQESKGTSWFSIFLLGLLIVCVVSVVLYRVLPRDTRRRLHARLPNLMQPAQPAKRRKDAKQNYPAEFLLYSDLTPSEDRNYLFCDGCEHRRPASPMDNVPTKHANSICDRGICRDGIIEISSENRVNVATDISGTTMGETTRSIAT